MVRVKRIWWLFCFACWMRGNQQAFAGLLHHYWTHAKSSLAGSPPGPLQTHSHKHARSHRLMMLSQLCFYSFHLWFWRARNMSGSSSSGLVGFTEILLVTSYQRWVEYSKTVQYKKRYKSCHWGSILSKGTPLYLIYPKRVHISTVKVQNCTEIVHICAF